MEMTAMMTQPQDAASALSGTASAGINQLSSRLSAAPLLFAAMLQEMLPPAQAGTGPVEIVMDQAVTAKDVRPCRSKACISSAAGLEVGNKAAGDQSPDPAGNQLAQLLAMSGQLDTGQSGPKPAGVVASQLSESKEGGVDKTTGATQLPTPTMSGVPFQRPGAEGVALLDVNGPTPPEGSAPPAQMTAGNGGTWSADARSFSPAGMVDVAGKMAAPGPAPEKNSQLLRGRMPDSRERSDGKIKSGQSISTGDPVQKKPAAPLPFIAKNLTGADTQAETPAEAAVALAGQTQAKVDYATFSGPGPAVQEGREALPLPGAAGVAGNPANLLVEVVFADQPAGGRSSEGNENSESGAKKKEKENVAGSGVTGVRTFDTPASSRFALQPKAEEPRNALHESILAQVRESVVSHDGKGNGMITVRLNPGELGDLQVKVRIENQLVKVEIITDNRTVRDALMANLDSLKETFLKQNLNMERFDVSTGGGNGFGQGFREERGGQQHISTLPFGNEAVPLDFVRENGEDDWGGKENSLVNLRL